MNIVLLGLEFSIGNLGCEALSISFLNILKEVLGDDAANTSVSAVVYSEIIPQEIKDKYFDIEVIKFRPKKPEFWQKCKSLFKESDVIFDFTMGDSFADIYGTKRFVTDNILKKYAIRYGKKFVLGPQTYGPYNHGYAKRYAKRVISKSYAVYTRDDFSREYVEKLFKIDPKLTTDVAFGLPFEKKQLDCDKIKLGINVSGLLWAGGYNGKNQFGLTVDYQEYTRSILDKYTRDNRYEVHLIPHVGRASAEDMESDMAVCRLLHKEYANTILADSTYSCTSAKNYISAMDIFIGARMHATIGAFSSGVATIPFSYSRKFEGLYESLDYPYVISARELSTEKAIQKTADYIAEYELLEEKRSESMIKVKECLLEFTENVREILNNDISNSTSIQQGKRLG